MVLQPTFCTLFLVPYDAANPSVQMFSLPGSMYISILFGAAYGIMSGLLLSCLVSLSTDRKAVYA